MAIETGVFIISVIMALGFMFYSFGKNLILAPIFKIFSIVIFFVLAVLVGSGLEVSSTTTETYQAIDPSDGSIETLTSTTTDSPMSVPWQGSRIWRSFTSKATCSPM